MPISYVVRYGQMRLLGEYAGLSEQWQPRGQRGVIQRERGEEIGEVLCAATELTRRFLENPARGPIVRVATGEDLAVQDRLVELQRPAFQTCLEHIARRKLQMDLVDVEAIL